MQTVGAHETTESKDLKRRAQRSAVVVILVDFVRHVRFSNRRGVGKHEVRVGRKLVHLQRTEQRALQLPHLLAHRAVEGERVTEHLHELKHWPHVERHVVSECACGLCRRCARGRARGLIVVPARIEWLPEEAGQAIEQNLELRIRMLIDVVREASPQLIDESAKKYRFALST